jgi:hypothetical protein
MRGHFRYLRFKTLPMTPRTPQCKVFCPLLLSSEHSGVPEDYNSQLFQVLGFTPTLGQSRGATSCFPSTSKKNLSFSSHFRTSFCKCWSRFWFGGLRRHCRKASGERGSLGCQNKGAKREKHAKKKISYPRDDPLQPNSDRATRQ